MNPVHSTALRTLFGAVLLLNATGCSERLLHSKGVVVGKTTRAEVIETLGEPTRVESVEAGGSKTKAPPVSAPKSLSASIQREPPAELLQKPVSAPVQKPVVLPAQEPVAQKPAAPAAPTIVEVFHYDGSPDQLALQLEDGIVKAKFRSPQGEPAEKLIQYWRQKWRDEEVTEREAASVSGSRDRLRELGCEACGKKIIFNPDTGRVVQEVEYAR